MFHWPPAPSVGIPGVACGRRAACLQCKPTARRGGELQLASKVTATPLCSCLRRRARCPPSVQRRIELVDSYARVIAMIEIEVEMDADLPAAEVLGECAPCPRLVLPTRHRPGATDAAMVCVLTGRPHPSCRQKAQRCVSPLLVLHMCCCRTVPPAGIEEQILRLSEIESLQEEWQIQVGLAVSAARRGSAAPARWPAAGPRRSAGGLLPYSAAPCLPRGRQTCLVSAPIDPQAEAQDEVERLLRSSAV